MHQCNEPKPKIKWMNGFTIRKRIFLNFLSIRESNERKKNEKNGKKFCTWWSRASFHFIFFSHFQCCQMLFAACIKTQRNQPSSLSENSKRCNHCHPVLWARSVAFIVTLYFCLFLHSFLCVSNDFVSPFRKMTAHEMHTHFACIHGKKWEEKNWN